jgi:Cu/Ag efflux pump CusA
MPRFERVTFLPHARERMEQYGISEEEVRSVLEDPNEEGAANFGRSYAQKLLSRGLVRVIYNVGMDDEAVVVSVMLRRR